MNVGTKITTNGTTGHIVEINPCPSVSGRFTYTVQLEGSVGQHTFEDDEIHPLRSKPRISGGLKAKELV
ncbi:MAG: hypothetical protein FWC00_01320 [Firmicutes bacterium]|nr:hypothetical protein [Bacillota bacterium]